ncbi:uncharacterized protein MELLADRAFT_115385 [Melampsora larici-populina 98AG31]|uniref:Uncharacterized protein n=1 Tax=Melampsora larici-populina (strain 98AG31 / pathotype 3-4-7) TaxID=747676 RepID=F4R8N8_MELLP|nr:uncharacterized protein MELLADRAFT_115385 [Melampsora larici-populina 98AG31]EGG11054.1 hypothetical protein MELLADRAFT_115385 [Melampsora larici-populina 98AG31]
MINQLPPDLIRLICNQILLLALPSQPILLLDPYIKFTIIHHQAHPNHQLTLLEPSPIIQAQSLLKSLSLVNKAWNLEARRVLWSLGIRFGLPNSFETVVKLVDPIGTFFDGGVEPSWISSPSASRHPSPHRTRQDNSIQHLTTRPDLNLNFPLTPDQHHQPQAQPPIRSGRRSISLKREAGAYVLEARILTYEDDCFPPSPLSEINPNQLPSNLINNNGREGRSLSKRQHHTHLERSISPLRGRILIQSLSQAFHRASIDLSPSYLSSKSFSLSSPIENENDDEEFIFDHQLDDLFNPAPYISSISFSKFRSHGMRRSIGEGHQIRFVTPERLLRLIKSTRSRYTSLSDSDSETHSDESSSSSTMIRKGHLNAVGFSEYMDSAISKPVLDEILLRGGVEVEYEITDDEDLVTLLSEGVNGRGRDRVQKELHPISRHATPHHTLPAPVQESSQGYAHIPSLTTTASISNQTLHNRPTRIERRMESNLINETPIQAIDFCGCISSKFRSALTDFIQDHALCNPYDQQTGLPQIHPHPSITSLRSTTFPWLTRLGLSHVSILADHDLADLLSGFPYLVDLDLSYTRTGPIVLHTLQLIKKPRDQSHITGSDSVVSKKLPSFRSLNLAKCTGLTEKSLMGFLCGYSEDEEIWEDPQASIGGLEELSLYGDQTLPTPISTDSLDRFFSTCPCFHSGRLITLDLSSIKLNELELEKIPKQPNLLQFGLSNCSNLSLLSLQSLLKEKMRMLEVLNLSLSCGHARGRLNRSNPSILSPGLLHQDLINPLSQVDSNGQRISNLRVIELDQFTLEALAAGAQGWRVVIGKGQRGWYVDTLVSVNVYGNDPSMEPYRMKECTLPFTRVLKRHEESELSNHLDHHKKTLNLAESLNRLTNSDKVIRHDEAGWMSRKLEILEGSGFLGRQDGLYGFHAFHN